MQLVLVMFRSDGDKRSFSLTRSTTVVGRKDDCDLRVPSEKVSRKHCRIVKDGDVVRLEDLGSSNGTYHNGHRINTSEILQAGDSIEIGPVVFVLQIDGSPADDELAPLMDRAAHKLEDELNEHPPLTAAVNEEDEIQRLEELDHMEPIAEQPEVASDDNLGISLEDVPPHESFGQSDQGVIPLEDANSPLADEHQPLGLMQLHDEPMSDGPHGSFIDTSEVPSGDSRGQMDSGSVIDTSEVPQGESKQQGGHELISLVGDEHEPIALADHDHHEPISLMDHEPIELEQLPDDEHRQHTDPHAGHSGGNMLTEDDLLLDLKPIDETRPRH